MLQGRGIWGVLGVPLTSVFSQEVVLGLQRLVAPWSSQEWWAC